MTTIRTALALVAATALGTAALPAVAQTTMETETMTETEATGALGGVSDVIFTADELDDIVVYGAAGEEIGEVDDIVVDAAGTHYIVLEVGGFLGIGDEDVAIPMDRFAARGDDLVLTSMTEEELEQMAEYETGMDGYTVVDGAEEMRFRTME